MRVRLALAMRPRRRGIEQRFPETSPCVGTLAPFGGRRPRAGPAATDWQTGGDGVLVAVVHLFLPLPAKNTNAHFGEMHCRRLAAHPTASHFLVAHKTILANAWGT